MYVDLSKLSAREKEKNGDDDEAFRSVGASSHPRRDAL
jgi:hypothetical protein